MGRHDLSFRQRVLELKAQVEARDVEFTEAAQKRIDRYLVVSHAGQGNRPHVTFNEEESTRGRSYFGYFVLMRNAVLDTFDALEYYRLQERIEELSQD